MQLVKIGDWWVNPDRILAVWSANNGAAGGTCVLLHGAGPFLVALPVADVVAALTRPEAPPPAGAAGPSRRALAGWGDDA